MVGAGFGGSTVNLVRTNNIREIAVEIACSYREETGIEPELFATRPAEGARQLL